MTRLANTYSDLTSKLTDFASFPTVKETATILEVHRTLQDRPTIPFLNMRVDPPKLNQYFGWSVSLILAFVLSTTFAMHRLAKTASVDKSVAWLFFHPTPLGPILGTLWLFFPAAVLALNQQWVEATIVGALSVAVVASAIACRLAIKRG